MKHALKCWLWKGLWLAAAISFVLGVVAIFRANLVLGLDPLGWYWNALVLGVLSLPIKLDCTNCQGCTVKAE